MNIQDFLFNHPDTRAAQITLAIRYATHNALTRRMALTTDTNEWIMLRRVTNLSWIRLCRQERKIRKIWSAMEAEPV